ncbi:hypothetical protein N9D23_05695 [Rubripirellula sp.]|jgi:hypothetical protein|nr:hypothetical protein [Rubripirellula sp.]
MLGGPNAIPAAMPFDTPLRQFMAVVKVRGIPAAINLNFFAALKQQSCMNRAGILRGDSLAGSGKR